MSQVNVVSTTDSKEDVGRAIGMFSKDKPVETKPASTAEKPVVEKAAVASEAPEVESEANDEESGDDIGEPGDTQENLANGQVKKKGGFQRRIDKLTKERTLAQQERDYWKEQHLNGKEKAPEKIAEKVETKSSSDGRPNPDKFETVGEYYEAVADWKFDQKQKAIDQTKKVDAAKSEHDKTVAGFQSRVREFQKTATDLPEVLEAVDHIPLNLALQEIFLTSDNGHQLMYELAKEPEEYERISKLSPLAVAREMGKREARMSVESPVEKTEIKTTKAPPPVKPISGKGSVVSTKDIGEMTMDEYKEWHKKTGGKTR